MYQHFIGIDISKSDFVVALNQSDEVSRFMNDKKGFRAFYKAFKDKLKEGLVVLETTGGYELALVNYLQDQQISVHRANTRKVKYFIRSFGRLGKTDAIDAKALAQYGFERQETLEIYKENSQKRLLKIVQQRSDLKHMLVQEKNRRQAPDQEEFKESFNVIIAVLEKQIELLEQEMQKLIETDSLLIKQCDELQSLNGVGKITAMQLLAVLPELGRLTRKKIASLAGLAPHPYESGKKIGHRYTKGGRAEVKRILFMAAMAIARSDCRLGIFYQRLIKNGKKKMIALTALMRKILVIANAKIRDLLMSSTNIQHG